jgi:predicted dehydrogenase
MERIPIAIVGCGGMGRRHLRGLEVLARSDFNNCELIAVCDLNRQNAEDLADEAQQLLGSRPRVWTDLAEMLRGEERLVGVDVTTDAGSHHRVATACLAAGKHVQVEKPLALTIRACNQVIEAARRAGTVLSVAENYRRDPMNRLARALIDAGAIGTPQLMIEINIGGGDNMIITPWRHQKLSGTIALDEGVHHADILMYYCGEPVSGYGEGRIFQPVRYRRGEAAGPGGYYAKWSAQFPEQFEATGEDAVFGYLRFANGAVGQWLNHHGAHGRPMRLRILYGSRGSLESQGDRNGRPLTLWPAGGQPIADERILEYAPNFRLSPLAAQLFGGERIWSYSFSFPETDAKILALEYHEFAECIATGTPPEVTGEVGRRAVAIVYSLFESGKLGRPVTIEEVEAVEVDAYQREIDQALGLV